MCLYVCVCLSSLRIRKSPSFRRRLAFLRLSFHPSLRLREEGGGVRLPSFCFAAAVLPAPFQLWGEGACFPTSSGVALGGLPPAHLPVPTAPSPLVPLWRGCADSEMPRCTPAHSLPPSPYVTVFCSSSLIFLCHRGTRLLEPPSPWRAAGGSGGAHVAHHLQN